MPRPSLIRDQAERTRALGLVVVLALSLAGAIVAAAYRHGWWTVAALVVNLLVELTMARKSPFAVGAMRRASAGRPARSALQLIAVVLLAGGTLPHCLLVSGAVAAVLVVGFEMGSDAARIVVARVRRLPLVTRNIDLGDFAMPAPAPRLALDPKGLDAAPALVAAVAVAIAMNRAHPVPVTATGLSAAVLLAAWPTAFLAVQLLVLVRAKVRSHLIAAATAAIERLAPEVVLYFAATPEETYQVRMWLEPLARLEQKVVIILRSHAVFERLSDVTLPVICTPYNGTIASLPLPDHVACLFVTHSGNNLSMLRRREVRSVFIGHGDSDKPDSVNPFARVYDEIWVAGTLGRRRYAEANVGVKDSAIIEVGRPDVLPPKLPLPDPPVVLYAPTWEGWGDDPHHSSLMHVGPDLIRRLSARSDLRVRYRAHPLTGRRNLQLRAAHQEILSLIGQVPPDEPINETFARSSGLIGDVSSVINEYLPFDRPYAVIDTRGLGSTEFKNQFPSTAGGFVLSPDFEGLDEFLAALSGGTDSSRTNRRELLQEALGDPATSQQRFADAVTRLLQ